MVIAVTEATEPGVVVDIVRVGSEEVESSYRNNVASAIVRVVGPTPPADPPNACQTLTASPPVLQAGRTSVVRVTARNSTGRPARSIAVRATGAGANTRASTDRQGVARLTVTPTRGRPRHLRNLRAPDRGSRQQVLDAPGRPRHPADAGHRLTQSRSAYRAREPPEPLATAFETRTHPCETDCPSSPGRFVPWIPTTFDGQSLTRA